MRKYTLGMCAMLLAFMLGPPGKLKADDVMKLVGVSQSLGDYYIAPYEISVNNGATSTTYSLICDDAYDEITMGESWTAQTETFSNLSGAHFSGGYLDNNLSDPISQTQAYAEAGWLAEQIMANISNTDTAGEYQYALWDLFDPGFSLTAGVSGYETQIDGDLSAAEGACANPSNCSYSGTIYTPSSWTGQPQNRPQEFLAVAMPEPMTLWSLLLVLAAIGVACKWADKTTVESSAPAAR